MQALYRKYRSKTLDEVVGQEHITETLARALKNGRISHAYLFTGPRGVGKTSVARILAHQINQLPYGDETHLDIIEIDAASNRRIDDIRDLRDKVHIAPTSAKYKVYIVDEVHMLTGESFNALLKTLEEPPSHVVFILATTEAHKLPATIVSRTQQYSFRPVQLDKVKKHLAHIAKQENIAIDDEALQLIAEHGEGSFRDSISLLDQMANVSGGNITAQIVEQNLGLAPKTLLDQLIKALQTKDQASVAAQLQSLEKQGVATSSLLPQLVRALQTAALAHPDFYALLDQLIETPRAYNPSVKLLTVLIGFTLTKPQPETPAKQTAAAQPKAILEVTKEPPKRTPSTKKEPVPEASVQTGQSLQTLGVEEWAKVLAALKTISTPLQSIFKQAQPVFDADKQVLTLRFKFQLHRKRADDSRAKSALAKTMLDVLGGAPTIVAEISTNAQPPDTSAVKVPPAELDETAKAVANLMGGGEAV